MRIRSLLASSIVTLGMLGTMTTYAATTADTTNTAPHTFATKEAHPSILTDLSKILGVDEQTLQSDLSSGKSLVDIAKAHHISENKLIAEMEASAKAHLDAAVQNGQLTSAKEQDILQHMHGNMKHIVEHKGPLKHHHGHLVRGVAEVLNMQPAAVVDQLKQGKSLAEIAKSKGVSEQALISKMRGNLQTRLNKAEKSGMITSAKKAKILAHFDATIKERLNRKGGFAHEDMAKKTNDAGQ